MNAGNPMAGWYKQHTSELASLEAFAQCGRIDLVTAWLRVTRWTVDHESDDLPPALMADAETLDTAGLRVTFAARCKKLLDQRDAMAAKRELKRAQVSSSELTSVHVSSSDHQDKTRQDNKDKKEKKTAERELPTSWAPTPEHNERATAKGLDVAEQAEAFRLHAATHARRAANWNAAFTMWLHKATARPIAKTQTQEEWFASVGIPHHSQVRR
jgi:hypothetical protein